MNKGRNEKTRLSLTKLALGTLKNLKNNVACTCVMKALLSKISKSKLLSSLLSRCQFHQCSMSTFYGVRSQKRKGD